MLCPSPSTHTISALVTRLFYVSPDPHMSGSFLSFRSLLKGCLLRYVIPELSYLNLLKAASRTGTVSYLCFYSLSLFAISYLSLWFAFPRLKFHETETLFTSVSTAAGIRHQAQCLRLRKMTKICWTNKWMTNPSITLGLKGPIREIIKDT